MSRKQEHTTTELFVGARLGAARTKAGISLEQAARDTRIRVLRLREIETDDFSGFSHPTYARLFLLDYAAYLGVPQDEIRPLLPDQTVPAAEGFQYLEALGGEVRREPASKARRRRRRFWTFLVSLVLVVAATWIALYFMFTVRQLERIRPAPATEETSPTPAPQPTPSPEPTATPEPTPTPPDLWSLGNEEPPVEGEPVLESAPTPIPAP